MLKCPIRMRSKSLHTLQRQVMENEDLNISQEEGVEMNNLVITAEEGKDHSAYGSANKSSYIFVTFSDVYTAVKHNICVADFPDHVKQMHEDMNHKFEIEFIVSYVQYKNMCNEYNWYDL